MNIRPPAITETRRVLGYPVAAETDGEGWGMFLSGIGKARINREQEARAEGTAGRGRLADRQVFASRIDHATSLNISENLRPRALPS